MAFDDAPRISAVLGPTNTGKTHYAVERMLAHRTGVIGLPLRLLAREVYDRIVALRGPSVVALVTGEERIVPARATWWVCTVEAMPLGLGADFVAIDEIQLCADPERGHVFTDRLLRARGLHETLFLGSDTMRGRIADLVPEARFLRRERFSELRYAGGRKLSRMPPRSAIVAFSVEDVYAIAELIRRQKGGAAVVMGALSPRTRNAQVALYQNGEVDYLVATDAIGMGLNLDIYHVAFAGLSKFDGRRQRRLAASELAQIAGRAGRYTTDGSFGVTGEAGALEPEVAAAIEGHRFSPLGRLQWRSDALDFASPEALIASLEAPSEREGLVRARESDDLATLRALVDMPALRGRVENPRDVRLLWDVCQVPDFRKVSPGEHAALCVRLFEFLHGGGSIPDDWLAGQVRRIDRPEGDIDALSNRLAYIRTLTYLAQRRGWTDDADHWRDETRAVEDRLSDALHARLTQRFVDRRTSVLMRRLKQKENLVASVTEDGEVTIDDQFIGRLEGFRFRLDPKADADQARTLRAAGVAALAPALSLRVDKFYNAPDAEFDVTEQGGLMWGEHAVGKLVAGADALSPKVEPFVDEDAPPEIAEKVRRRLSHWLERRIAALFEPLIALRDDAALTGMARGVAFHLVEALGVAPRGEISREVRDLDQEQRSSLRRHGVRFGQFTVFQPALLKPAPTRLRLVLWALKTGLEEFPEAPPPGLVTIPAAPGAPQGYYPRIGYRLAGDRAIRIDMLERLADMIRGLDASGGFEATPDMLSITGLTLEQFARLMAGMGYHAEPGTRPKRRPPAAPADATLADGAAESEAIAAPTDGTATDAGAPLEAAETAPEPVEATEAEGAPTAETQESANADEAVTAEIETDAATDGTATDAAGPPAAEAHTAPEPVAATEADPGSAVGTQEFADADEAATVEAGASAAPEPVDADAAPPPSDEPAAAPEPATAEGPASAGEGSAEPSPETGAVAEIEETETFYLFTRAPKRRPARGPRSEARGEAGAKPKGKPRRNGEGGRPKGKPGRRDDADTPPVAARSRPQRPEKAVDPDNPFAALLALKLRD